MSASVSKRILICGLLICFALMFPANSVLAEPAASGSKPYCPQRLAAIDGAMNDNPATKRVEQVYRLLNCPFNVQSLPGRRGIVAFNEGTVDGAVFRFPNVEQHYTRAFIRSAHPLIELDQALWGYDHTKLNRLSVIGYVIGRKWHEDFAKANRGNYRIRKYNSPTQMRSDFVRGKINGMLVTNLTISYMIESGEIVERPIMKHLVTRKPFYHYLSTDYAPFMADFSSLMHEEVSADLLR